MEDPGGTDEDSLPGGELVGAQTQKNDDCVAAMTTLYCSGFSFLRLRRDRLGFLLLGRLCGGGRPQRRQLEAQLFAAGVSRMIDVVVVLRDEVERLGGRDDQSTADRDGLAISVLPQDRDRLLCAPGRGHGARARPLNSATMPRTIGKKIVVRCVKTFHLDVKTFHLDRSLL